MAHDELHAIATADAYCSHVRNKNNSSRCAMMSSTTAATFIFAPLFFENKYECSRRVR